MLMYIIIFVYYNIMHILFIVIYLQFISILL